MESILATYHPVLADLVVIHDGIERLDPHWVNVSIQHYPLGVVSSHVGHVSHDVGKQTYLNVANYSQIHGWTLILLTGTY